MESKNEVWLYRNENETLFPVFKVCEEKNEIKYELNNVEDSIYSFCKVEFFLNPLGECEVKDIYTIVVPGDSDNPHMTMTVSTEEGSPFVYVFVKNSNGEKIAENNYLVGEPGICVVTRGNSEIESETDSCTEIASTAATQMQDEDCDISKALMELEVMPGLGEIKRKIEELVEYVQLQQLREKKGLSKFEMSQHLVFQGNPGTGKTTVARLLAKIYYSLGVINENKVVEVDRSSLVDGFIGGTAIKTQKVVESAIGGILYIDEAYTLAKEGNDFGQEAIDTILKAMEDHRNELLVIVAGYPEPMSKFIYSNPGLKSRFKTFIDFKDYSGDELYQIFLCLCEQNDLIIKKDVIEDLKKYFKRMAKNKGPYFANGREVRNYFETTISHQAHRISKMKHPTKKELSVIERNDLGIENDSEIAMNAIEELNQMIGLETVKREVSTLVAMVKTEQQREAKGLNLEKISYHMVFTGNPGTGKTTVARIMAKILKSLGIISKNYVVEVSAADMIAGYTGQTAIKTKDVIQSALGGVLFIDEAYTLSRSAGGFGQEAIDTLLKYMEDYRDNLVVIVAGYKDEMDSFISSNPGLESRFTNYIHFEDYSSDELMKIFEICCKKEQYIMDENSTELLNSYINGHIERFHGNGRDIRNLFEKIKKQQASRLSDGEHSVVELTSIVKEDVESIIHVFE